MWVTLMQDIYGTQFLLWFVTSWRIFCILQVSSSLLLTDTAQIWKLGLIFTHGQTSDSKNSHADTELKTWTVFLHVRLSRSASRPPVAHVNTAPLWVKATEPPVGPQQARHELVWCAKLRCVGLTVKWEDREGFKEGTSHNERKLSQN